MSGFFSKEAIIAQPGFNRWKVPPASVAIHLCIGSVYAWSIFNSPLARIKGVVVSSSGDWNLEQVVWINVHRLSDAQQDGRRRVLHLAVLKL